MPTTPSLFDDDPDAPPPAASLVPRKLSFGASQKGKNVAQLLKQVESLRAAFEREKRRLEDALIADSGLACHLWAKREPSCLSSPVGRRLAGRLGTRCRDSCESRGRSLL